MSPRQIMKSKAIVCTVPDERKSTAVKNTMNRDVTPDVPATILKQHAHCTLYLDDPAASKLDRSTLKVS
jgi:glucosamine-6-phosphate deaminase